MPQSTQHSQWVLDLALQIDERSAGFCGSFLRASVERRHVIAAFLAARSEAVETAAETASFLLRANHRTILNEAYREAPRGMRGALGRSGPAVHEKRFYSVLRTLLAKPRHSQIARCISQLAMLNLTKLRVINALPERLCRTNVVEAVQNVGAASDLKASVSLLVEAGADEAELTSAIRKVRDHAALRSTLNRAMLACRAADHPVPPSDTYRPISTARDLHRIATKYRNCARNYTIELLDSEAGHAFAEVRDGKHGGVAHLRRSDGQWRLDGLFGPRNNVPNEGLRQRALAYLAQNGIQPRERGRPTSAWSPVRRITATHLFEFEIE